MSFARMPLHVLKRKLAVNEVHGWNAHVGDSTPFLPPRYEAEVLKAHGIFRPSRCYRCRLIYEIEKRLRKEVRDE